MRAGTNYSNLRGYRWPVCRCGHSRRWHGGVSCPRPCAWCTCWSFDDRPNRQEVDGG